jgi:hypothetical protein
MFISIFIFMTYIVLLQGSPVVGTGDYDPQGARLLQIFPVSVHERTWALRNMQTCQVHQKCPSNIVLLQDSAFVGPGE